MKKLLKNCDPRIAEFVIIDSWTMRMVERLPRAEALAKYGECELCQGYTEAFVPGGFRTSVWVRNPGMHLGYYSDLPITLPSDNPNEASFVGKKTGIYITVTKHGPDDYSVWFRDEFAKDDITAGFSVRGTMMDIVNEIREEV